MAETAEQAGVPNECEQVADMLKAPGTGVKRICPKCKKKIPTLVLEPRNFECTACGARGDVIDLIALLLDCDEDEAEDWFLEHKGQIKTAPPPPDAAAAEGAAAAAAAVAAAAAPAPPEPEQESEEEDEEEPFVKPSSSDEYDLDNESPVPFSVDTDMGPSDPMAQVAAAVDTPSGDTSGSTYIDKPIEYEYSDVLDAFLARCRPLPDKVMALLKSLGVLPEVANAFGLRYYPGEYQEVLDELEEEFSSDDMLMSGLLIDGTDESAMVKSPDDSDGPGGSSIVSAAAIQGCFTVYHDAKVPYMLIPFRRQGLTLMIKAKPLVDKSRLKALDLPKEIMTTFHIPCMFNYDCAPSGGEVLLVRQEIEAMAAVSAGAKAVAYLSATRFDEEWARMFGNNSVAVGVIDHQHDPERYARIAATFDEVGLPTPERLLAPKEKGIYRWIVDDQPVAVTSPEQVMPAPTAMPVNESGDSMVYPVDEPSSAAPAKKKPTEKFVAAVPAGPRRSIVIQRREGTGEECLRLMYWFQSRDLTSWRPEPKLTLDVPLGASDLLIQALTRGAHGETVTPPPEWLRRKD